MELTELTAEVFRRHLGETFRVLDGEALELELAAVESARTSAGDECFSICFKGPRGSCLPQKTYRIAHAALGEFALFLVPIGPDREGFHRYEAVFNRRRGPGAAP